MGFLVIPESSLVYADTSIFIYSIEQVPHYSQLLEPLWNMFQNDEVSLISSELTLLETLVLPIRRNNTALADAYESLLANSKITLAPIEQATLREAARLRASTNLKTPDAIHAATALMQGCTLFLTNDDAFRRIRDLPVTVLSEVLAAE